MTWPRLQLLASLVAACLFAAALAPAAAADVLVGVAGPTRGPNAATAADISRAARLAAERINAEGGVLGQRIEIVAADDGCAGKQAEDAARTLIARRVGLVIGHPCAGAAIAAAPLYAQAGVLFIAPATRHPALTDPHPGPTVFRLAGRDGRQGAIAGAYLAREFAGKPLAIVHGGSRLSRDLAAEAAATLKAAGRTDVLTATIAGAQKEYGPLIAKLAAAHVEALYFTGYPIEGGLLLRQMRRAGLKAAFLGSDTIAGDQFAETAREEAEGAGTLLAHDPARMLPVETLRAKFPGLAPTGPFVATYAAMEAWRAAAQQAQSSAADATSNALQHGAFDTVIGRVAFDEKGNADVPSYDTVWWKDGAWRRKP